MEKPLLVLKPNIVNALFPLFLRNFFYSFIIVIFLFGLSFVLKQSHIIDYPTRKIIFWLIFFLIAMLIIPLLFKLISLYYTKYYFFKSHVTSEFKFIRIKRYSVPYHQIVNITTRISLWDRICKAGDITLHTAEDKSADLVLYYIKNPMKIESGLYKMIHIRKIQPPSRH